MSRRRTTAALATLAALLLAAPAQAAPRVNQMVVFDSGRTVIKRVNSAAVNVRLAGRRCAAGDGTALAALVRSHVGRIGVRDFGSCSSRPRDGAGLFVRSIGSERNRGQDGWAYKVGRRGASAGAADPAGPRGRGRLRAGQRVTWFYCRLGEGGCQRSLALTLASPSSPVVTARVRGYDDEGRGVPVEGATVRGSGRSAITGADGRATLELPPGRRSLTAEKEGLVRSFPERVLIR